MGAAGPPGEVGPAGPVGPVGPAGPSCPAGFHLEEIDVHQRFPVDQDLPITVCVVD